MKFVHNYSLGGGNRVLHFLGHVGTQKFGGSLCHLRPWVEELGA
jgi:hypothetical protein